MHVEYNGDTGVYGEVSKGKVYEVVRETSTHYIIINEFDEQSEILKKECKPFSTLGLTKNKDGEWEILGYLM